MRKKTQPLKDQFALITGASRGIGLAIANALAEQSCNLILTARNEKSLGKVSKALRRYGVQVLAQPCDVRDRNSVKSLFRAIRREFPRLDILINNAASATKACPSKSSLFPRGKTCSQPTSTAHS
jgi:short-subunit dehydrogenase